MIYDTPINLDHSYDIKLRGKMRSRVWLIFSISFFIMSFFSFVHSSDEVSAQSDEVKFSKGFWTSDSDTPECHIIMETKYGSYSSHVEESEFDSVETLLKKIIRNDSESINIISNTNIDKPLLALALNYAIEKETYEKILKLVEKGADIKKINYNYYLRVKNIEILKLFIKYEADLSDALLEKLKNNEFEHFKLILDSCPVDIHKKNYNGLSPLMAAVIGRNFDAVYYILKKGANVNDTYVTGDTPLMMALANKPDFKIARLLVENGANVNAKNKYGEYPLELIMPIDGNDELVNYLIEKGSDDNNKAAALNRAIVNNKPQYISLIEKIKINYKNIDFDSLSNCIAPETFKYLIKNGFEINDNVINILIAKQKKEILKYIDQNIMDLGDYLINIATAPQNNHDKFMALRDSGVKIKKYNPIYNEAIFSKVKSGDFFYTQMLIEAGVDVNIIDNDENNLLMSAIQSPNCSVYEFINFLIKKGIDVNAKNKRGVTALMLLISHTWMFKEISLLLNNGADVTAMDNSGHDALYYLVNSNYKDKETYEFVKNYLYKFQEYSSLKIDETIAMEELKKAISDNNFETFKALIGKIKNPFNIDQLLRLTSKNNNFKAAQKLIDIGARVNDEDMIKAIKDNNVELLTILLKGFERFENYKGNILLEVTSPAIVKVIMDFHCKKGVNYDYATEIYYYIGKRNTEIARAIINNAKKTAFEVKNNPHQYSVPRIVFHDANFLNMAIINEMDEILELLIKKGADINRNGIFGLPPIIIASWFGRTAALKILLEKGANVNSKSTDGTSALMFASMAGHNDIIDILIDHGADIYYKNGYGFCALIEAITCNRTQSVELLKKRGANFNEANQTIKRIRSIGTNINTKDYYGVSLLMRTASEGNFIKTKYLIDHGANVNEIRENRNSPDIISPLVFSVMNNNSLIYKLLIDHGADPYLRNDEKIFNSLLTCALEANPQIFKDLVKNKPSSLKIVPSEQFFYKIFLSSNLELLDFIFKNGFDINEKILFSNNSNEKRYIPLLHYILNMGNFDDAKFLIEHGFDKNSKSEYNALNRYIYDKFVGINSESSFFDQEKYNGGNALFFAVRDFNLIKLLCESGFDINFKTIGGYTPLMYASLKGSAETVKYLIEHNANVNAISNDKLKMSPLIMAILNRSYSSIVNILLDHGAKIDQRTIGNWTPLMIAAHEKNLLTIELLLSKGANVNETNDNGETALDIVYNYSDPNVNDLKVLELLKNSGAISLNKTYR